MSSSTIAQSATLFLLAGQCEISGGWLVWLWLREGRPFTWASSALWSFFSTRYSYLSARPLRPRLCRLWRLFYYLVSVVGLDFRRKCARPLRLDRRMDRVKDNVVRLLKEDRIDFLFGPYSSHLTVAVASIAESEKKILWNHGGTSDTNCKQASGRNINISNIIGDTYRANFFECLLRKL